MSKLDIGSLAYRICEVCIHHANFDQATTDIQSQLLVLQSGEILTIVGPSRVGKSRATYEAIEQMLGGSFDSSEERPVIWVDNENSQASGEFSTMAFMLEACRAIEHPIYGRQDSLTDEGVERLAKHIARVPERTLRDAFECGLRELRTRYLVIDEAHHVMYVKGGETVAKKVLDSWKCLAKKADIVLVLIGSYDLVRLMGRVPHLIGRQRRPLEFPRYRSSSIKDMESFEEVLRAYSEELPFASSKISLSTWNRQLFEGSLGCVGHASLWIRSALAWTVSHKNECLTWEAFEATAFVMDQFIALRHEIEEGEKLMETIRFGGVNKETSVGAKETSTRAPIKQSQAKKKRTRSKPFRTKTKRRARGLRA